MGHSPAESSGRAAATRSVTLDVGKGFRLHGQDGGIQPMTLAQVPVPAIASTRPMKTRASVVVRVQGVRMWKTLRITLPKLGIALDY
jgi:hypothetical protein